GHVAADHQQVQEQKQGQDVGKEGDDGAHAGDDAVHDQAGEDVPGVDGRQAGGRGVGQPADGHFQIAFEPVADGKGQKEDHRHDEQEHRDAPHLAGQQPVGPLGQDVLALFVDQHLVDDLADEVVFLVDDVGLVAAVQHPGQVHRVFFGDLLVPLQQLDGVPAQVGQAGVAAAQLGDDLVDLVLDLVRVDHGVFGMV